MPINVAFFCLMAFVLGLSVNKNCLLADQGIDPLDMQILCHSYCIKSFVMLIHNVVLTGNVYVSINSNMFSGLSDLSKFI